jgi:FAD synthase
VRLYFAARIREERKFSSPELLVAQMQEDVVAAKKILAAPESLETAGTSD